MTRGPLRLEYSTVLGVAAALVVVLLAQWLEGMPARSLWQPAAALVVFGGTAAAVFVSFPAAVVRRTATAVLDAFIAPAEPAEAVLDRILRYAHVARRHGLIALEPEIDATEDPFFRTAIALLVDGVAAGTVRQILAAEHDARQEHADAPAELLEAAGGYAPTMGILGAVLGLIRVMQSLSEPDRLGAGIAVAFVATVYGLASANLLLFPLATKLRGRARHAALNRQLIVEGCAALQEGLHPRLIEQKLSGLLGPTRRPRTGRHAA